MSGMSRPQKRSSNPRQRQTGQRRKVKKTLKPPKTLSGISAFQDEQGKVAIWPSARRRDAQIEVLEHLAAFFESGRIYTAGEVGNILKVQSTLADTGLLLAELQDADYLRAGEDGKTYWRSNGRPAAPPEPAPDPERQGG